MRMRYVLMLAFASALPASAAEIPFPAALDAAAVVQSRIADINREALVLGNGDLIGLLWERNGTLCLRVAKNDIWDARVDTSQDVPLMKVDVPNQQMVRRRLPAELEEAVSAAPLRRRRANRRGLRPRPGAGSASAPAAR